ncbi:MAG TPA: hypothetical protein VFG04_21955 [Planctomycetaceae bacterium]|jgi:hypothetical protein|nr:hypothetical protein [Planctomycetaceae bacterium]
MRLLFIATLTLLSAVSLDPVRSRATADDRAAAATKAVTDVQRRVRELIYILRYHRPFVRADEWASAIRELVQIGKPAVPELVAELDHAGRTVTLRGLAFALRAIGDPRAVRGLIHALGKPDLEAGSDYGLYVLDRELMAFMREHQDFPDPNKNNFFSYGRPINEIFTALVKITKHEEPANLQGNARAPYWTDWWATHGSEFLNEKELQSVQVTGRDRDLVEEAGLARFGPLFPTGNLVELGPVHEVELQFDSYVNANSYIDFDTGRLYQSRQGISGAEAKSDDFVRVLHRWLRDTGVDAHCNASIMGDDLEVWLIDNNRWETLQSEIHTGHPLDLGREATYILEPFGRRNTDLQRNQTGTFLFITREGGRGVVQTLPGENDDSSSRRIRYRMWGEKRGQSPAPPIRQVRRDESDWEPERIGILKGPGRGQPFVMNLETGKRETPPDSVVPAHLSGSFANDKGLAAWCRAHGDDIGTMQLQVAGNVKPARSTTLALIGLDMNALAILPSSYEEMSLAELKDLIARYPPHTDQAWMAYHAEPRRDTYVIATKSGTMGVLQIKAIREEGGGIAFRYRLAKNRSRKD